MSATQVVNLRREAYDVYVGRAGRGRAGPFGNPHKVGRCPACSLKAGRPISHARREDAIAAYRAYFLARVECDPEFRAAVLALAGKRLGCFCAPFQCHGDVIKEWLESGRSRKEPHAEDGQRR